MAILAVLKKNRAKLSTDATINGRRFQESLEKHFNESVSVLHPLIEKLKAADNLIDQIVYKLYGLTPEEIAVVEGLAR